MTLSMETQARSLPLGIVGKSIEMGLCLGAWFGGQVKVRLWVCGRVWSGCGCRHGCR